MASVRCLLVQARKVNVHQGERFLKKDVHVVEDLPSFILARRREIVVTYGTKYGCQQPDAIFTQKVFGTHGVLTAPPRVS